MDDSMYIVSLLFVVGLPPIFFYRSFHFPLRLSALFLFLSFASHFPFSSHGKDIYLFIYKCRKGGCATKGCDKQVALSLSASSIPLSSRSLCFPFSFLFVS